jgi:hypothetical protein
MTVKLELGNQVNFQLLIISFQLSYFGHVNMTDDKQLDHLIGVLYETVFDSSRWREAIGLCGHYAGGVDAQLLTLEKNRKNLIASLLAGTTFSFAAEANFVNHYLAIDPRRSLMALSGNGVFAISSTIRILLTSMSFIRIS